MSDTLDIAGAMELAIIKLERVNQEFIDKYGAHMPDEALEAFKRAAAPMESTRRLFKDGRKAL